MLRFASRRLPSSQQASVPLGGRVLVIIRNLGMCDPQRVPSNHSDLKLVMFIHCGIMLDDELRDLIGEWLPLRRFARPMDIYYKNLFLLTATGVTCVQVLDSCGLNTFHTFHEPDILKQLWERAPLR